MDNRLPGVAEVAAIDFLAVAPSVGVPTGINQAAMRVAVVEHPDSDLFNPSELEKTAGINARRFLRPQATGDSLVLDISATVFDTRSGLSFNAKSACATIPMT